MLISDHQNTAFPLELTVDQEGTGGVTGLTPSVAVRDGSSLVRYLDWADNTFKTSGWATKYGDMTEVERGHYRRPLNVAVAAPQLSNPLMAIEYQVDEGDVIGDTAETLAIVTSLDDIPAAVDSVLTSAHGVGSWGTDPTDISDIADAVWDEAILAKPVGSAGEALYSVFKGLILKVGQVAPGSTETVVETDLVAPNGSYNGSLLVLVDGSESFSGFIRHQVAGQLELARPLQAPPSVGSSAIIVSIIQENGKTQMSIRGRIVLTNAVVLDQADFFEDDNFTRIPGLTTGDLTVQVFFNNSAMPWTLVVGDAVTDALVRSGQVYFSEIQSGFYNIRFRPNAVGFWRLVLTYPVGEKTVTQDYDVVGQFPAIESGLKASFTRP
jgi:hypothetical protein